MIIQFNLENNTQVPSVQVCTHFFGGLYTYNYVLFLQTRQLGQSGTIDCDIWPDAVSLV